MTQFSKRQRLLLLLLADGCTADRGSNQSLEGTPVEQGCFASLDVCRRPSAHRWGKERTKYHGNRIANRLVAKSQWIFGGCKDHSFGSAPPQLHPPIADVADRRLQRLSIMVAVCTPITSDNTTLSSATCYVAPIRRQQVARSKHVERVRPSQRTCP